jgi:hypothetical protein
LNAPATGLAVQLRYYLFNHQELVDLIANPHLDDDPGTIITFPGNTFGTARMFHPVA